MNGARSLITAVMGGGLLAAPFLCTARASEAPVPDDARAAQVVFLGEQHDNPGHHRVQAAWVAELAPRALVFEMLTPEQAMRIGDDAPRDESALGELLGWDDSGWPDFAMYFPIFEAVPTAAILGAGVPRDQLRQVTDADPGALFGAEDAARFGLDEALPQIEQQARIDLHREAHCDALPEDLLPRMVAVQRVRDAALARTALDALKTHGAPVVVITGNGHARQDWGAPFLLQRAAPEATVFSLGQGEAGAVPEGVFGQVIDGPAVDRGDPCAAFR